MASKKCMYGRVNKKQTVAKREIILEPTRTSIFDIVQTNFKYAERSVFVHRLLYLGEYNVPQDSNETIEDIMRYNHKATNTGYCVEPFSGVLLYYNHYFCYIAEGAEEILQKHLCLLFDGEHQHWFQTVKLLAAVHHIRKRFLNKDFLAYNGRPNQRVESIDPKSNLDNSMIYVQECMEKMYNFANEYIQDINKPKVKVITDEHGTEYEISISASEWDRINTQLSPHNAERDPYAEYLPEIKLLDFLVQCKHVKPLKDYWTYYGKNIHTDHFLRKQWPCPRNFLPYDVFDKPYEPVSNLPKKFSGGEDEVSMFKDEEGVEEPTIDTAVQ